MSILFPLWARHVAVAPSWPPERTSADLQRHGGEPDEDGDLGERPDGLTRADPRVTERHVRRAMDEVAGERDPGAAQLWKIRVSVMGRFAVSVMGRVGRKYGD